MTAIPRITVGIPLYKSEQFVDVIISNIEGTPAPDVEFLISDRHCYDDSLRFLRERFWSEPRVRFLEGSDQLDWVEHINLLMREARGRYWRLLPHDDSSPGSSLELLAKALDQNPEAVVAYGPTRAYTLSGDHLPEKSHANPHPIPEGAPWVLRWLLDIMWRGYFAGAFKGVVRRQRVIECDLMIRSTLDQVYAERAWLFGLGLVGSFVFVPDTLYFKRFHDESVHAQWTPEPRHFSSINEVLAKYLFRYVENVTIRDLALEYLVLRHHDHIFRSAHAVPRRDEILRQIGEVSYPAWRSV